MVPSKIMARRRAVSPSEKKSKTIFRRKKMPRARLYMKLQLLYITCFMTPRRKVKATVDQRRHRMRVATAKIDHDVVMTTSLRDPNPRDATDHVAAVGQGRKEDRRAVAASRLETDARVDEDMTMTTIAMMTSAMEVTPMTGETVTDAVRRRVTEIEVIIFGGYKQ